MTCELLLCLANLYIEMGAGYSRPLPPPPPRIIQKFGPGVHYLYDFNNAPNPRGRLAIGYEVDVSNKVRWSFELRHESWLGTTNDRGDNAAWVSLRLRPWQWEPK